ncbi:MAG: beta-L-arabinofuranosidase domain-containing protein [Rikenellaceae bacterium]
MRVQKLSLLFYALCSLFCITGANANDHYISNRSPLIKQPYVALPIGAIKPEGMLLEMVERQQNGLTGNLDEIYESVCGETSGWLGGEGDAWERGPYWIDGLTPLAYMLDNKELITKVKKWVDWSIDNQRADGFFGPGELEKGYTQMRGVQQDLRADWWPRMVMLKVLQQYYMATEDERVLSMLTKYFKYMLKELPTTPLDHWSYWGSQRGADNLAVVYWLYNITGEKFLIELGDLIHKQTYDWTSVFHNDSLRQLNPLPKQHCVNIAQGLKAPVIYYQRSKSELHKTAPNEGLKDLRETFGFVTGMYGGDEHLHSNNPTQGSELCSAVELMYSLESMLPITADMYHADYLEKIAYNILPTQSTDDYMRKQYFHQTNQICITAEKRDFFNDNAGHLVFGTTTGYPCCLTNMHQGIPKFIQNLWYATADNGVAAFVYGESSATIKVAGGQDVTIKEETSYPFSEDIKFTISTEKAVKFPFHLRVPMWCEGASFKINGEVVEPKISNNIAVISRVWNNDDVVELKLPMTIKESYWYNNSVGFERGPLVYALRVEEDWRETKKHLDWSDIWNPNDTYWEVYPASAWNYSLSNQIIEKGDFKVKVADKIEKYPWTLEDAPITIEMQAFKVPYWTLDKAVVGYLPSQSGPVAPELRRVPMEKIKLIPFGCTTIRVAQFPVTK